MIEAGKKTAPSSKADHYFHIDYIPFPDSDPYRIDCITYGLGAKVTHMCGTNYLYDEIVQVHTYQDVSWVVLNRVHFLDTSADEKLESIFAHKIDIRLCDDKGLNQIFITHFNFPPIFFILLKLTLISQNCYWFPSFDGKFDFILVKSKDKPKSRTNSVTQRMNTLVLIGIG